MSARDAGGKVRMHVDPSEKGWIRLSIVVLIVFAIAISVAGFMLGIQVPTDQVRVDPRTVLEEAPWSEPGVREITPGEEYKVYIVAQHPVFTPNAIEVPAGAKVTFYVTSIDVQHGFKIDDTNVNFMVIPGQVSTLTTTFDDPTPEGEPLKFICTEYCGASHHFMSGEITVTE